MGNAGEKRKGRRTSDELWEARQPPRSRGEGSLFKVETSAGEQWRATKTLYMAVDPGGKKTSRAVQVTGTGGTK